jgi:hypothetical protein
MDKDKMETILIEQGKSLERVETKIDHLPTKEDIKNAIDDHKDSCTGYKKPSLAPRSGKPNKTTITVGGLLTGAGIVLGWLANYLFG